MAKTKPKFKGKYPGPDKFKGDPKKLKEYRAQKAAQRNAGSKPTTEAPKAEAPKTEAPLTGDETEAGQQQASTGSSETGGLNLQSTIDIENAVNEANSARNAAISEQARLKQAASDDSAQQKLQAAVEAESSRGRTNATNAYRGLRGTSAYNKKSDTESSITQTEKAIDAEKTRRDNEADAVFTAADTHKIETDRWAGLERQKYTGTQKPTAGTKPTSSGVKPTKPAEESTSVKDSNKSSVLPAAKTETTKPKWKGKYRGPDRFKGDKAKLAAWRAAGRPKK